MNKPFSNLINKDKSKTLTNKTIEKTGNKKSTPLIVFGFIVSLSSIFLLLYTINNKFGWFR